MKATKYEHPSVNTQSQTRSGFGNNFGAVT